MILSVNYIDNNIIFDNENINVIEIENKDYFYRVVSELNSMSMGNIVENIHFFDNDFKEINLYGKISVVFDFFNFNLDSKKLQTLINKKINENLDAVQKTELSRVYEKVKKIYMPILNDLDLNLTINSEFDIEMLIKLLNVSIYLKDSIIDNLILMLDVEKLLKNNEIIVFINLKQYLDNNELLELYKYSLYNNVRILLIDSQSYGIKNKFEKKLIVDQTLEEFLI